MSTTPQPTLGTPQEATEAQPKALQPAFPVGAGVHLKFSPASGEPGIVTGHAGGKVIVRWPDWNREGRYFACSLLPAATEPSPESEQ